MQTDKTTINDLSIFNANENESIFDLINFTTTSGGSKILKHLLEHPHYDLDKIEETQQAIQVILANQSKWPTIITNGTIMVVEKFYETAMEEIPRNPYLLNVLLYRFGSSHDYSLIKYSVSHFVDFFKGLQKLVEIFRLENPSGLLGSLLHRINVLISRPVVKELCSIGKHHELSASALLTFAGFLKNDFKHETIELTNIFSTLDAYHAMALACTKFGFCFPEIVLSKQPFFEATALFHPLLATPVAYDLQLNQQSNFLFLTGANMAGKSTFIKAVGVAAYLAHAGMGVPAKQLRLSLFNGLLSNIQVEDNLARGESYFFNEVQRIKKTIEKINDGRTWLILIDELFKGTNVQDAMRCSTAVIEGFRKMSNAIFILSTHLYEISDNLRQHSNIQFNYFETCLEGDEMIFNYRLKEGISNDRLGYLILQKEGVVEMLNKL